MVTRINRQAGHPRRYIPNMRWTVCALVMVGLCHPVRGLPSTGPLGTVLDAHAQPSVHISHFTPASASPIGEWLGGTGSRKVDVQQRKMTLAANVMPQAQIVMGAVLIFAVERCAWASGLYLGRRIPSAPAGMLRVYVWRSHTRLKDTIFDAIADQWWPENL